MTDCGVCIGGYDGDTPENYIEENIKAKRSMKCYECEETIPAGVEHQRVTGKWEQGQDTFHFCAACAEIQITFSCGEGRVFGALWVEMEEVVFPELTLLNKCFQKLSIASRQFLLKRWNEWKFAAVKS